MGTRSFNIIDKIIAYYRLKRIEKYINGDDIILDFGCGHHYLLLKKMKNKIRFGIGLDYEVENKKEGNKIELINYRYTDRLPFEKNYFNKVILMAVIEHFTINNLVKLLNEIKRVLRNGGRVVLTTPTPKSKSLLELLSRLHIISGEEIADHKKYYAKEDIFIIAKKLGFSIEEYGTFQMGLNSIAVLVNHR
ncbi:hypothetical protein COV53_04545 [Candidatus Gottesmanbacteria bacterium CG11_big_fil_rev_8_21_14_0_20_37_11]|uniref:Methyltransferase type 11 domain-containing protein n=2 Tax=Candidatus Gottesmaniibacteriota TaxID=1752720 RepID=A0A2M7RPC5_9BACT|nr:MAG: hypothetical protein COX23_00980 [Candidatus Gottesmanbacteria bacterium CG23_combo_of_CG06-09_8_20_14_all_37_19]PIR08150.1 MAG: hypothetical protein COV53_04545 [Candidatus Gottesmanbacteria bacterium CG11_big_fil_rev_8_21_14_0_20_37_11]PIZ02181.1 MAG: hypothetical protein COY59_06165 [Candidatus Gottesmanbacteria bacterium CG_4_10_14_0_8_um_filter_37_24]